MMMIIIITFTYTASYIGILYMFVLKYIDKTHYYNKVHKSIIIRII